VTRLPKQSDYELEKKKPAEAPIADLEVDLEEKPPTSDTEPETHIREPEQFFWFHEPGT